MAEFCSHIVAHGDDYDFSNGGQLGVSIIGTIVQKDALDNVALIKEEKTGRVRAVKAGFKVLQGFRVIQITEKYMVMYSGKNKKTHLVYQDKFARFFTKKTESKPTQNTDKYSEPGFERVGNSVRITESYRDNIVQNQLSDILMQATAIPFMEDGEIKGFQVLQIDEGSIYDKGGFQNGDVVTEINGIRLDSVSGAVRVLQNLKTTQDIELSYSRNGSNFTKKINVE